MDLMSLAEMHQRPEDPYLPPGFRFHPTDEELVYYLRRKVLFNSFRISAITEVDLNKCEPWDLPGKAAMGEKEWYFYTLRDRKYPTGMRTNRATEAGYWKATGKDRTVMSSATSGLVGMKKTLVFYRGRAPKGIKSNWIMHEYRLEGEASSLNRSIKMPKDAEWVVCRIFQKVPGGKAGRDPNKKAAHCTGPSEQHHSSSLPGLMEESTRVTVTEEGGAESDSSQNDQLPSLSGNSYSVLEEQPNNSSNWIREDSAPAATSTPAVLRQNRRPAVPDLLKVSPVFFGGQSNSLPVTLDHPFGSYGSSSFVKYTPPRPLDFPQLQQQQPVDISSLKALDQFSKALAGPFSVSKPGIRTCKLEPRTPVYPNTFRSLDTSVAGWLSDAHNLSAYSNPQPQLQNFSSGSGGQVPSNVYRLPGPTSSAADIEPMWNY